MKIIAHESKENRILNNAKIQLQIQGSGYLWVETDKHGQFELDDKYEDKKISTAILNSGFSPWTKATDGATLEIDTKFHAREEAERRHSNDEDSEVRFGPK